MPLGHFPQLLWYILTGIPLFLAAFLIVRTLELPRHSLGLQMPSGRGLPIDLGVAASGIGLGLVEWWILRPEPLVQTASIVQFLGLVLILLVFTGFLEELLFRGLIQHAATGLLGPNAGLFLTAALFAILHVGWHSLPDLAFVFAVALYFGLTVRYTRSLLGVTIAHGATNVMLFVVLPLALP
jgi:membrane protease YdiL (CAAX protease family)